MKTIILCGGKGTRLHEETEFKPKPLVKIGGYPILLHIMNIYAHYGHKDFILALGYKGDMIKDYFLTLSRYEDDFSFDMSTGKVNHLVKNQKYDYKITFAETGLSTKTSGRILKCSKYLDGDKHFMVTYGDGVSTVSIKKLAEFHNQKEKENEVLATTTAVHPVSKYGQITFDKDYVATSFEEKKPVLHDYINGGFLVLNKDALAYFEEDEMLFDSLNRLTKNDKLAIFKHDGFWYAVDTYKDYLRLNEMWEKDKPWAVWDKVKDITK